MASQRNVEASNTEPVVPEVRALPADHARPAGFTSRHIHLAVDDGSDTLDRFAWVDKTGRVAVHRNPARVNGKPGDDYRVSIIVKGAAWRLYDDKVAPLKRIARAVSKLFIDDPSVGDRLDRGDTKTDAAAIMAAIARAK
jgi:hypothetical protein